LYCSPNFPDDYFKKNKMGGACSSHRTEEQFIRVLLRKYREVRLRREDNKINFKEIEREEVELINLAACW
jgi:hypothetical protein